MPVLAYADQSATLDVGDVWVLRVLVLDDDDAPTSATVTVLVTLPDGTTSAPTASEDPTGVFTAEYTVTSAERHLAVVTVSGAAVGVVPFTVWAVAPSTGGLPDLANVLAYLGEDSHTAQEVQDALDAETAAQRRRCRIPPTYPEDLGEALRRRVARNLAARAVPVAQFTSFEGGGTSSRVPTTDPEIVRLEAPYRRLVVG